MKIKDRGQLLYKADPKNIALLLVGGGFFLGALSGCLFAASVSGLGSDAVGAYIQGFLGALQTGTVKSPGLLAAAFTVLRWPLLVLLLGATALGVVGIPLLLFFRGFLLSFCVSSLVQVLGGPGVLLACLLLGVGSLLSVSVLFVMGTHGIVAATGKRGEKGKKKPFSALLLHQASPGVNMICGLILLFCIVWELLFVPGILRSIAHLFVL